MGTSGGGTNIFRGHDNVQGATDLGVLSHTLPGYYGLSKGAWATLGRVSGAKTPNGWPVSSTASRMPRARTNRSRTSRVSLSAAGSTACWKMPRTWTSPTRCGPWFCGATRPTAQTRGAEMKTAMEKLDMLVVVDPYPTVSAVLHDRTDGVYLLPAATQFETRGSVTASNRSFQWRETRCRAAVRKQDRTRRSSASSPTSSAGPTGSSAISRWKTPRRRMSESVLREIQQRHVDDWLYRAGS